MNMASDWLGIMRLTFTTALTSLEASPVTVIHPATMPAMEQATATVMQPRPPASRELPIMRPRSLAARTARGPPCRVPLFKKMPGRLTRMVSTMATAAENWRVRAPVDTMPTRTARGRSR